MNTHRPRNEAGRFALSAVRQQELPEVARRVKALRINARLSQRELADLASVSVDSVVDVERGKSGPKSTTPQKLMDALARAPRRRSWTGRYPDGRLSKSRVQDMLGVDQKTLWRWAKRCPYLDGEPWPPVQRKNPVTHRWEDTYPERDVLKIKKRMRAGLRADEVIGRLSAAGFRGADHQTLQSLIASRRLSPINVGKSGIGEHHRYLEGEVDDLIADLKSLPTVTKGVIAEKNGRMLRTVRAAAERFRVNLSRLEGLIANGQVTPEDVRCICNLGRRQKLRVVVVRAIDDNVMVKARDGGLFRSRPTGDQIKRAWERAFSEFAEQDEQPLSMAATQTGLTVPQIKYLRRRKRIGVRSTPLTLECLDGGWTKKQDIALVSVSEVRRVAEERGLPVLPPPHPANGQQADGLLLADGFTGQPTKGPDGTSEQRPPKRGPGRPKATPKERRKTQERNDRLLTAWRTGHFRTYAELGREFGNMKKHAVHKALKEAERREKKRKKKAVQV